MNATIILEGGQLKLGKGKRYRLIPVQIVEEREQVKSGLEVGFFLMLGQRPEYFRCVIHVGLVDNSVGLWLANGHISQVLWRTCWYSRQGGEDSRGKQSNFRWGGREQRGTHEQHIQGSQTIGSVDKRPSLDRGHEKRTWLSLLQKSIGLM